MSEALREVAELIATRQDEAVLATEVVTHSDQAELTITVVPSSVAKFVAFLRDDPTLQFQTLVDITAVDYPGREKRFDLVYHFLSMRQNMRIRVKAGVREKEIVPSVTGEFQNADWFEREVFDMFGIMFSGHPDLRRILTDYGFRGHPLRKDFPTTGYTEVRYDEEVKRVVYEPVSLVQDYRTFDLMSPWEGADYILPGDEKAPDAAK